jgi:FMN phosphatase YigB (HAD superfamily)
VCGAASFGFRTFWINRSGAQADELGFAAAAILTRLDELPAALAR